MSALASFGVCFPLLGDPSQVLCSSGPSDPTGVWVAGMLPWGVVLSGKISIDSEPGLMVAVFGKEKAVTL